MRADFYVYAWRRPDTGDIFYIGKGRGDRATYRHGRNGIFRAILDKLARNGLTPSIEIIHDNLTEADAFALERAEIASRGRIDARTGPLANLTDGGEGPSGMTVSEATRAKISASRVGLSLPPASEERKSRISAANKGRKHTPLSVAKNKMAQHSVGLQKSNKSGFRGVSFHSDRGKWGARIMIDGKERNLGRFDSAEEAALARDRAAIAAFGQDNCFLNFPEKAA